MKNQSTDRVSMRSGLLLFLLPILFSCSKLNRFTCTLPAVGPGAQTDSTVIIPELVKSFTYRESGFTPTAKIVLYDGNLYGTTSTGGHADLGVIFKVKPDGSLYGTTSQGATHNSGVVFKMETDGSEFQILREFDGANGMEPLAGLLKFGNHLYGTTYSGGDGSNGIIFSIQLSN
jgi:uncharacterized repeat protein (TIGR03803 family)